MHCHSILKSEFSSISFFLSVKVYSDQMKNLFYFTDDVLFHFSIKYIYIRREKTFVIFLPLMWLLLLWPQQWQDIQTLNLTFFIMADAFKKYFNNPQDITEILSNKKINCFQLNCMNEKKKRKKINMVTTNLISARQKVSFDISQTKGVIWYQPNKSSNFVKIESLFFVQFKPNCLTLYYVLDSVR